jgi:hypothetical protein
MRMTSLAAVVLATAAACSTAGPPPPSIGAPDPVPEGLRMPVELDAARAWLLEHGFACTSLEVERGVAIRCTVDNRQVTGIYLVVDVLSDDGGLVRLVQATVDHREAPDSVQGSILGFFDSTVVGMVANPPPASVTAWLQAHVAASAATTIDDLGLELSVTGQRSTLRVWRPNQR